MLKFEILKYYPVQTVQYNMTQERALEIVKELTIEGDIYDESSIKIEPLPEPTGNNGLDFIIGANLFEEERVFWISYRGTQQIWCYSRMD